MPVSIVRRSARRPTGGCSRRSGPNGSPTGSRCYSEAGDRTFAEVDANANRLVRALRARGVRSGDGVALLCSNRPEFIETVVAVRRAGLRLTTINWHLTGEEAGYIVDDCDATAFVADTRVRARSRAGCGRARAASACTRSRSAERSPVSKRGTRRSPSRRGARSTIRRSGGRCSTRRARPVVRRACTGPATRAATSTSGCSRSTTPTVTCTCAPARCTTRRRSRSRVGARRARRADRADGRLVGGGDAAAHRAARHHAHAHGAHDVPPAALAARRREGARTTSRR